MLIAWVAALAVALGALAPLAGEFRADFMMPGSDSAAAERLLTEHFPGRSTETIDVVWHAAGGARSPAARARIGRLVAAAERLPLVGAGAPPEVSRDGRAAIVRLPLDTTGDRNLPQGTAERLIALAERASGDGVRVALAGWAIGEAQASEVSPEVVGFAIAALVLLMTFGSLVAAGLPLVTALFGLGIGTTLVGALAALMDVPDFAPAVAAMMAIGVGIDYALLVITRYRGALAAGREPQAAIAESISTAGRSVLLAGLIAVISLLGLFAMRVAFLDGVAISSSLAVLVAALAAVTLLPALLGFAGRGIDRLRIPGGAARAAHRRPSRWLAYARAVQRRPWTAALAGTAVIAVLALPLTDFRLGFPDAGNDAAGTMTRQAYDLVAEGFGPGASGPLLLTAGGARRRRPSRADAAARARGGGTRGARGGQGAARPRGRGGGPRRHAAHVAPGRRDAAPRRPAARAGGAGGRAVDRDDRPRRRHDGRGHRPERLHAGAPAAVHRRGRDAVVPAGARRLRSLPVALKAGS